MVLLCSNICTGNVRFPTSMTQDRTTNRHFRAGTLFVFTASFAVVKYKFDNIVTKELADLTLLVLACCLQIGSILKSTQLIALPE